MCEHTALSYLTFSGLNEFHLPSDPKGEDAGIHLLIRHPLDSPEKMSAPKDQAAVTHLGAGLRT